MVVSDPAQGERPVGRRPASLSPRPDGRRQPLPCLHDRHLPGLIGAADPVIVEGRSPETLYCNAVASLRRGVIASTDSATGTSVGVALLFEAAAAGAGAAAPALRRRAGTRRAAVCGAWRGPKRLRVSAPKIASFARQ